MPQTTQISVTTDWTQITDGDVTAITFQNVSSQPIFVRATAGNTPPTAGDPGLMYSGGQGEVNRLLADLFPGTTTPRRVWARATTGTQRVFVSNA